MKNQIRFMFRLDLLQNDKVRYAGQPIAVVIAETLEAATEGADLLAPRYEIEPARMGLDATESFLPSTVGPGFPAQAHRGDVEAELAGAAKTITATYETPAQYHNPMEPHAIVAVWDGDTLSIDTPSQGLAMAQGRLAGLFGIAPDKIHIRSPFLGGGFGCKGMISGPQVLGAIAARAVGRPVKLVLRREQMFGPVGHRAPTRQTLRLGADGDGALIALDHRDQDDVEHIRRLLRAGLQRFANALCEYRLSRPRMKPSASISARRCSCALPARRQVRSRSKALSTRWRKPAAWIRWRSGSRIMPRSSPSPAGRFPQKRLRECYRQGAERFGWERRSTRAAADDAIVTAFLSAGGSVRRRFPPSCSAAQAKAVLRRDGSGVMEIGAHDMGQGAWTALAQIAADGLGLDLDQLEFRSGTSDLPDAGIAGGSAHTATAGTAIYSAGADAIARLADLATSNERSPLFGAGNAGVIARGGRLFRRDDAEPQRELWRYS